MTKEQYEEAVKHREVLELFYRIGEYVGGCNELAQKISPDTNTGCPSCMSAFLIRTYLDMLVYESNM
jgi:hypothetical protein